MAIDSSDRTANGVHTLLLCGHCGDPLCQYHSVGKNVVYFYCVRCLNSWRTEQEEASNDEEWSSVDYPSPVEVFRPETPGAQPSEVLMTLPIEAWHWRQSIHMRYATITVHDSNSTRAQGNDEDRADGIAAKEHEGLDKERKRLMQRLMTLHQAGNACPACLADAEQHSEPAAIPQADPETLPFAALQEQYEALLDAHERLQQEYEDLEVVYHATLKRHEHQDV